MKFQLNPGQQAVVDAAVNWFNNSSELVFQYTGAAGTGKTVVLFEIINRLGLSIDELLPMSFTGTAAIVMRNRGLFTAKTIHASIYEPVEQIQYDGLGRPIMDPYFNKPKVTTKFVKREQLEGVKLILIDEASMTPKSMVKDIESFGIKIIACGDLNQLPPVADEPGYLVDGDVHFLTDIMRQGENSGIIYLADRAIKGLPIHYGTYNNAVVIDEDMLTDDFLIQSPIILTCKNATRETINDYLRDLRGVKSKLPMHGEPVICRKNNWSIECDGINLVNGLRGTVENFPDVSSRGSERNIFKIDFRQGRLLFRDVKCDYDYFNADYDDKNRLRNSPYSPGNKIELAYAITTHLSQGSQYYSGIFIEEWLRKDIMPNLIYTGITRFSDYMIYVKRKPKFY